MEESVVAPSGNCGRAHLGSAAYLCRHRPSHSSTPPSTSSDKNPSTKRSRALSDSQNDHRVSARRKAWRPKSLQTAATPECGDGDDIFQLESETNLCKTALCDVVARNVAPAIHDQSAQTSPAAAAPPVVRRSAWTQTRSVILGQPPAAGTIVLAKSHLSQANPPCACTRTAHVGPSPAPPLGEPSPDELFWQRLSQFFIVLSAAKANAM